MKNIRHIVALFLLAVFLASTAWANTSSINPNVPAQNSPLSSSVLRGNFANANSDMNTQFAMDTLSANQLLGTVFAGNAGPLNVPTCSTGALSWTPGTGFGCNSISALSSPVTQALVFTGAHAIDLNALSLPTKQLGTVVQVGNADTIASRVENDAFGASAYFTGVRWDGTNAAPTTLQTGDEITGLNAWGYNGTAVVGPQASVGEFAAAAWTTSSSPTYVDVKATATSSTTQATVARFTGGGGLALPATVTGGDMGPGTINAAHIFKNGVELTPATSGSMVLISTQTASTSASLTWTGLGNTYNSYFLSCTGLVPSSSSGQLGLLYGEGGSPTWNTSSNYTFAVFGFNVGGSVGGAGNTTSTYLPIGDQAQATTANFGGTYHAWIDSVASTTLYKTAVYENGFQSAAGTYHSARGSALWNGDTNAITGFKIQYSTGTIVSGVCSLYAVMP